MKKILKENFKLILDPKNKKLLIGACVGVFLIIAAVVMVNSDKFTKESKETSEAALTADTEQEDELGIGLSDSEDGLQKNANEAINKLVNDYLTASKNGDMDSIATLVSTGDELTKDQVQKPYEYVEKIQNVDCYTLPGAEDGSYIVYVYYELKFVNIDTVAPGLMQLYVSTTSDDSLVIMLNELDTTVEQVREEALEREDVQKLISIVNTNLSEAANSDEELKELITKLNQTDTTATEAPAATEAAATEAPAATEAAATEAPASTNAAATEAAATNAPEATKAAE